MEQHKTDRTGTEKIDLIRVLQEFWKALGHLFWLPAGLAILCAALMGLRTWRAYSPVYEAVATFQVNLTDTSLVDIASTVGYYDKTAAQQMGKTFPYLLQSELMQNKLQEALGTQGINGTITAQSIENTNLFAMQVKSSNPEDAYHILETVIEVYPDVAVNVVGRVELTLISAPVIPEQPMNSLNIPGAAVRGGLLGLLFGLLIVLLYAMTRKTIRESDDVEKLLNQKCIATIPRVVFKRRTSATDTTVSILNSRVPTSFQESIRGLRIKVLRAAEKEDDRVILITSTMAGEGKTTVAANLALSLSKNGARVILVDLDLRKPSVKKHFGIQGASMGPTELIEEKDMAPEEHLIQVEGTSLYLLAGDKASDNPHKQINSKRISYMIRRLRECADVVILDTPPSGILADSVRLARTADAAIYVLGAGRVEANGALDGIQFLGSGDIKMLGCVLNGAKTGSGRYGYGYGYDYGYGYGNGYGYGKSNGSRKKSTKKSSESTAAKKTEEKTET